MPPALPGAPCRRHVDCCRRRAHWQDIPRVCGAAAVVVASDRSVHMYRAAVSVHGVVQARARCGWERCPGERSNDAHARVCASLFFSTVPQFPQFPHGNAIQL